MRILGIDFDDSTTLKEVINELHSRGIYNVEFISMKYNEQKKPMSAQDFITCQK